MNKKDVAMFVANIIGSGTLISFLFLGGIYETITISVIYLIITLYIIAFLLSLIVICIGGYDKLPKSELSGLGLLWFIVRGVAISVALLMTGNNSTFTAYIVCAIVMLLCRYYRDKIN